MFTSILTSLILLLLSLFPIQTLWAEQSAEQCCAAEESLIGACDGACEEACEDVSEYACEGACAHACEEALLVSQEEADADDWSAVESHYLCISSPQGYLFSVEESNGPPVSQTHKEFSRRTHGVRPDSRFLHTYTILSTKFSGNLSYKRVLHTLCLLRI